LIRINGILGSSGKVCIMGMLSINEEDQFYLEDSTMKVKLNLDYCESDKESYFTEGNILLCEGEYDEVKSMRFNVNYVSHPPLSNKQERVTKEDLFGAYTKIKE
jgi:hypothetical protein